MAAKKLLVVLGATGAQARTFKYPIAVSNKLTI